MFARVLERERIEEARAASSVPLVPREVREDHRTKVLSRPHTMKRDRARIEVDPAGRDGPTVEQMIKRTHERVDVSRLGHSELGAGSLAFVVRDGTMIDQMVRRGLVSYRQWQAGALYQSYHHLARLDPKIVADYGQSMGGGQASAFLAPNEAVATYRRQLADARVAIGSQLVVECVEAILIADRTFYDVGVRLGNRSARSARRKGSEIVKAGLDRLVGHFRLHNVRED